MCGIVGYIGRRKAHPVLLNSLSKLEYRGYDSCGVAVLADKVEICKDTVRVNVLEQQAKPLEGFIGIGHTRWATHGEPSRVNAHPHCDCTGRIAVVHNGVITNFHRLREQLASEGHILSSQTDTEVLPHLIEKFYDGDLEQAVALALDCIEGSYAIAVLMEGEEKLVVARYESPLIIGVGDQENIIASDVPAVLDYTSRVIYLEDGDIAVVTSDGVRVKQAGAAVDRRENKILWNVEDAQKSGYEHFMLKEIHEQPKAIRDTLAEYAAIREPVADFGSEEEASTEELLILACGTSYHAGLIGKYIFEGLSRIQTRVELASEFNYCGFVASQGKAIVISQSGETADSLKALKRLKEDGCQTIAITNVVGSTISRVAGKTVYTRAGPEMSVAATKSFLSQLIALYWLALPYAKVGINRLDEITTGLKQLPVSVQHIIDNETLIAESARMLASYDNVFYIGRGINYPVALEGALKLKEISYIHAEGYAAGELKHGPFALLGTETPVVALVTRDNTYEAILTGIKEVKARRSPVLAVAEEGDDVEGLADCLISVPKVDPFFSPVINCVALQLLAYYVARQRGCPIDFPKNLAKSVTVE
jgi:glucosamine--fructose-6-phosphate aminotransferase (isomerizing)